MIGSFTEKTRAFSQIQKYLRNAPVAIAILTDDDYKFAMANDLFLLILKRNEQQVLERTFYDVLAGIRQQAEPLLNKAFRSGESCEIESFCLDNIVDGNLHRDFLTFRFEPFKNEESEETIGVFVAAHKITEQVLVQSALMEGEEHVRQIADAMPMLIAYISEDERYVFNNKRYEEWFGWRAADVKGRRLIELLGEQGYATILPYVRRVLAGERVSFDALISYANRGEAFVNATYIPDLTSDGEVRGFFGLVADITERKKAENITKESEKYFRTLADNVPAMVWLTDATGCCTYLNREWYDVTGQTEEEAAGFGWLTATHPDDVRATGLKFQQANEVQVEFDITYRLRFANGDYRWVKDKGRPRFDDQGTFLGFIGTVIDIHQEIKGQQLIHENEEKYRSLFNTMEQGFCIAELIFDDENKPVDYRFVEVNPVFSSQTGLHEPEGKTARQLLPNLEQHWIDLYGKVALTGESVRFSQGSEAMGRWFDVYAFRVGDPRSNRIAILFSDISERKKAEEQLKERELRFRALVTATSDVVYRMSPDWKVMRSLEGQGFLPNADEAIDNWMEKYIHPKDQRRVRQTMKICIQNKSVFELEHQVLTTDGSLAWTFSRAIPIMDDNGEIIEWFGAARDVTERYLSEHALKESENKFRNLASHLEQLVKDRTRDLQKSNEDLQQFAHVASHDLKEPVRKVKTFIDRLSTQFGDSLPDRAQEYLSKMDNALDRMNNMIEGVLKYSSLDAIEHKKEPVDVNSLISQVENDLEVLLQQKKATLIKSDLPAVLGSELLLYQLFYNLVNNALKFSRNDVAPVITIESCALTVADLARLNHRRASDYTKFLVTDNGIGFKESEAQTIFGAFTRLHPKDRYEGTGLGLAMCSSIAERHGGMIYASGEEGNGAAFTILLANDGNS